MHASQRRQSGFTLIEVSIAMATVAVLAFGVMLAFTTSSIQDRDAYETTRTQNIAVSMMEQVEAMSFAELQLLDGQVLPFVIERWTFIISVNVLDPDLLSLEVNTTVTSDQSGQIRLVTLKSRKQEAF